VAVRSAPALSATSAWKLSLAHRGFPHALKTPSRRSNGDSRRCVTHLKLHGRSIVERRVQSLTIVDLFDE
jgi:hypothetical protein